MASKKKQEPAKQEVKRKNSSKKKPSTKKKEINKAPVRAKRWNKAQKTNSVYHEEIDDFSEEVKHEVQRKKESADEYLKRLRQEQGYMPVGDHLEELRVRIIRSIIFIVLFAVGSFFFYQYIWDFIMGPMTDISEEAKKRNIIFKLIIIKLPENFMIQMKTYLFAGFLFALPFVLFEIWRYILPAIEKTSKIWGYFLLFFSVILFWAGMFTARYIVWPIVSYYLIFEWMLPVLGAGHTILKPEIHLTVSDYLSFFFMFHVAFGLAFQLPIISIMLALMDLIHYHIFLKSWRGAIVAIAVLSAVLTPPDIISMLAMMLPLLFLYFISGLLVWLFEKKKRKQNLKKL
ncbi:MAG: twin-arginine translocase subunit TatC [Spirochaetia bacterium]|nr:twin-arginine translocase subunit TatC [Spirochaetia bacterium]